MKYTLGINKLYVFFRQKNGAPNVVATAQMKFASEARPNQYIVSFGNTEPTCMTLFRHFMEIEGRILVHQTERHAGPRSAVGRAPDS